MNSDPVVPRKRLLLIVFLVVFTDLLGFGIVLPLMPVYARQFTADLAPGQQVAVLASLMTSFSIMQLVFAPIWGRVSDRVGRRPVLLLSLTGSTLFYALFGIATLWRSLPWMFVARIGAGIAGATIPTAQACIADATPPEKRARGMALIGAAFGLGFTFGPLLGALALFEAGDVGLSPWPGYTAAGFSATALLLAIVLLPESLNPQAVPEVRRHFDLRSLRSAFVTPSMGLLLAAGFLNVFAFMNFETTISWTVAGILDVERSSVQILIFFACIGLVQSLVQGLLVRRLAGRIGESAMAWIGGCLSIVGYVLLALAADPNYGGLGQVGWASAVVVSGFGFLLPAIQSLISRRSDPAKQGGILGLVESISALARIAGSAIGVALYQPAGTVHTLPFWTAGGLMCVALALVSAAVTRGRDWAAA
jgi:MFS transporter, DHA1 family, tetracycline resistance protein